MAQMKKYKVVSINVNGVVEERMVNARTLLTHAELEKRIKRQKRVDKVREPSKFYVRTAIYPHAPAVN